MIHIFFVGGTFGSTVEYVLRSHTCEYSLNLIPVSDDGSMHSVKWLSHHSSIRGLETYYQDHSNSKDIVTAGYPCKDGDLVKLLEVHKKYSKADDHNILIYCNGKDFAEQNLLFMYHKIAAGKVVKTGLSTFVGGQKHDFTNWNQNCKSWKDLESWQFREWFSLYYPGILPNWINSQYQIESNFFLVSGNDILYNTIDTLTSIIKHCGLTINKNLVAFANEWQGKQQYILQEYQVVCKIVENTIQKKMYTWHPLNIIAESIVQQKLREQGYEIKCDGLNTFPTNSLDLHQLLEPSWRNQ